FVQYFASGPELKGHFLRTVPVKEEIHITQPVAPYDDVKEIIKNNDRIRFLGSLGDELLGSHFPSR
ncbi:MAG: hypothetical protein V2B19_15480, partial [Pseudomonadota bacterium]